MNFMDDTLADGMKLRVLTVVDTYNRECVALEAAMSFRGGDVAKLRTTA
jgi:transposase InsO family protein